MWETPLGMNVVNIRLQNMILRRFYCKRAERALTLDRTLNFERELFVWGGRDG